MKNYAGKTNCDAELEAELTEAGIPVFRLPESLRDTMGEVQSIVVGDLCGWEFKRAWYYWVAKGPGIPPEDAEALHATHGQDVRVAGHCGCPSPLEWYEGFAVPLYHIDTQEGLNALANTIKTVKARASINLLGIDSCVKLLGFSERYEMSLKRLQQYVRGEFDKGFVNPDNVIAQLEQEESEGA